MSGIRSVYSVLENGALDEVSCSLMELFFLYLQIPLEKNGSWKWVFHDPVHFDGINRPTRSPTPLVLPVPRNVHSHCDGEPGLDYLNFAKFTSTHPHVLFPF